MPLSDEQLDNLKLILDTFNQKYPPKYTKGAVEHNSCLSDMPPLELAYNLLEEGMDTVAYAVTLIDKLTLKGKK